MTARPLDARPAEAIALAALAVGGRMDLHRRIRSHWGGPIIEVWLWDSRWIVRHGRRDGYSVTSGMECPWGVVGDRLWVRERWSAAEGCLAYHAAGHEWPGRPWRPSRSMPQEASRAWLRIVGLRPERGLACWEWVIAVEREREGV